MEQTPRRHRRDVVYVLFAGPRWQRCRAHFRANLLASLWAHIPLTGEYRWPKRRQRPWRTILLPAGVDPARCLSSSGGAIQRWFREACRLRRDGNSAFSHRSMRAVTDNRRDRPLPAVLREGHPSPGAVIGRIIRPPRDVSPVATQPRPIPAGYAAQPAADELRPGAGRRRVPPGERCYVNAGYSRQQYLTSANGTLRGTGGCCEH